ncbi:hypothetical protein CJ030_MR1G019969 [Morella rubra]|uniref:S-protein homolog n=1 Tax=Morella rubra TaxID=262757 RepID=A0A6A1WQK2_9ROSI|nr:hypothetical protein CJ030_MR1G019969 [Morella rubra]
MSSRNRLLLVPLVLFLSTTFDLVAATSSFKFKDVHVQMFNNLSCGSDLTVHCKSGDDDLGVQVVRFPKGFYEFEFSINLVETTLFFCSFRWRNAFHWFDIYSFHRDSGLCTNCIWKIRETGPCLLDFNYSKKYDICYKWNK